MPGVIATEDRGVVQITLCNPGKLNALTAEMWVRPKARISVVESNDATFDAWS